MRDSNGSASILEYTLVLPACLISVMLLFFTGYYLCHCAVLDAAADRAALTVQSIWDGAGNFDIDNATDIAINKTQSIIDAVSFLGEGILFDTPVIDVRIDRVLLGRRIRIEISQGVRIPVALSLSFIEDSFTLRAHSSRILICPAEMVRNTDFTLQLIGRYTGTDIDLSSELEEIAAMGMEPLGKGK